MTFEGFRILRTLHSSSRSHLYLAEDIESGRQVVIKVPSVDLGGDETYLKRFMMEEWVARRINSAHVLRPFDAAAQAQLSLLRHGVHRRQDAGAMDDRQSAPRSRRVRDIVEQIAKGLRAFHRMEMLHQDVRPENVMIDRGGTVRIIDFGSVRIAGVMEAAPTAVLRRHARDGTIYSARISPRRGRQRAVRLLRPGRDRLSDADRPASRTARGWRRPAPVPQQVRVAYLPARSINADIPVWIDGALRKAVSADPAKRYEAMSEFTHDLRHPREAFLSVKVAPLLERNPVLVWQAISLILFLIAIAQAMRR